MSRTYKFLNVGGSGGYGSAFTDKGTEYIGFQARDDGKLVFLRKGYKNLDDADSGQLSTFGDVLTKEQAGKLKLYGRNPTTEADPLKFESLADLADSRDGYDAQGNLIKARYQRPYRAVEYEGLRAFLDADQTASSKSKNKKNETNTKPISDGLVPFLESEQKSMTENTNNNDEVGTNPPDDGVITPTPNAPITTDEELKKVVGDIAAGNQGNIPQVTGVLPTVKDNELLDDEDYKLGTDPSTTRADDVATVDVNVPTRPTDETGAIDKDFGQVGAIERAKKKLDEEDGVDIAQISDTERDELLIADEDVVQGVVSDESQAEAQTLALDDFDKRGTVKFQLGDLFSSIEEGGIPPAWASPAVRKISSIMQQRGMGSSSMASAAMMQALMESGIPIATADANTYAKIQLQNLTNKQETALANAAVYASMDKANLNARLTAQVNNAKTLLAVETANLSAEQSANELSYNALVQAIFKDSAQENARKEINAKSEMQVEEFFTEMDAQIETANANREVAVAQFNAGEENSFVQFEASFKDSRDKFEANMGYAIDQSNAEWRRNINTQETAIQNETNRINVQNLYNATTTQLNALWQKYRDNAAWNFQKSESEAQRRHEIAMLAMEFSNSNELYDKEQRDAIGEAVGDWLASWIAS
tara:strand:+ start:1890 stop:3842 length:1953 start_codon:yes stop_codon:yes gene_type:complete